MFKGSYHKFTQALNQFRLISVNNTSPFDATVRLVDRRNPPILTFVLGRVSSGEQKTFEERKDIENGEEVKSWSLSSPIIITYPRLQLQLQVQSQVDWTSSVWFMTYTRSSLRRVTYLITGTRQNPEIRCDGVVENAIDAPAPSQHDHDKHNEDLVRELRRLSSIQRLSLLY